MTSESRSILVVEGSGNVQLKPKHLEWLQINGIVTVAHCMEEARVIIQRGDCFDLLVTAICLPIHSGIHSLLKRWETTRINYCDVSARVHRMEFDIKYGIVYSPEEVQELESKLELAKRERDDARTMLYSNLDSIGGLTLFNELFARDGRRRCPVPLFLIEPSEKSVLLKPEWACVREVLDYGQICHEYGVNFDHFVSICTRLLK